MGDDHQTAAVELIYSIDLAVSSVIDEYQPVRENNNNQFNPSNFFTGVAGGGETSQRSSQFG